MRKTTILLALSLALSVQAQQRMMIVDASKPTAQIQPEMYGVFFEDINFGGSLYTELVNSNAQNLLKTELEPCSFGMYRLQLE